jgi:two-component system KDP operon response regulator KdpE
MNSETIRVLIVDDDFRARQALRTALGALGFEVEEAMDGEEAIEAVKRRCPELILLDVNMPGISGVETCMAIRRLSATVGIIMLTVRDSQKDKIDALDSGADDYVGKPFSVGELGARMRAFLRRSRITPPSGPSTITAGAIEMDVAERTVKKAGQNIHLTPKEFDLLHLLVSRAGKPVPHAELLKTVWGFRYGSEVEYLRTFVNQLRKKIEDDPSQPKYLLTHPFVGYRFEGRSSG